MEFVCFVLFCFFLLLHRMAYAKMNKNHEAEEAYKNALRLDPDNADYQNNLSVTQQRIQEGRKFCNPFMLFFNYVPKLKLISFDLLLISCKCSTIRWSSTEFCRYGRF